MDLDKLSKIPNFAIFAKIANSAKILQYGIQGAFPCILQAYVWKKKFTENYPKFTIRDFHENREFCKTFDVTLFGPHQSTSTPIFRSISHFVTKVWKKQAFV